VFLLANLAAGVTSVIPEGDLRRVGSIEAAPLAEQIRRERVTRVGASPALLERLCRHLESAGSVMPQLTDVFTGGAPVFPSLLDRLIVMAPNARLTAVYGSTEAEPIAHIDAAEIGAEEKAAASSGSGLLAGKPVDEIDLRVIPASPGSPLGPFTSGEFDSLRCRPETVGEIVVAGPHVLGGYLDGIGDEENKIVAGGRRFHRTGDLGRLDEQGRLWLLGRASAAVRDGRGDLYPFTVEAALSFRPDIARSALVGRQGERVLVVEPATGAQLDPEALLSDVAWAGIDRVHVLDSIPVDPRHNAKVDYPALERLVR
jgi:acyl-CoA synthetase (AMP-forming)/AMP-acid ligase II